MTKRWPTARAFTLALALLPSAGHGAEIVVQTAASLANALRDIAVPYEAAHPGDKLRFNVGASGALLQQIAKGAPADVFASADQETMDQAQARRLVAATRRRDVAANTLVLVVPMLARAVPRVAADLAQPAYARIAIGLPASVPAGRYTQAALEAAGLWAAIEPKTIGANSVRQALDYVARGEVDAAFVYATDAALMRAKVRVAFTQPTPTPIRYPVAPLVHAPNPAPAQRFVDFLFTPVAQGVLARHGFAPP